MKHESAASISSMPSMPSIQSIKKAKKMPDAYTRKINKLIRQADRLEDAAVVRALKILEAARRDVAAAVASTEWQLYYLPQLKAAIERALTDFGLKYGIELREAQKRFWDAGIDMVDLPIRAVGLVQALPAIDITALSVLQGFSTDLVTGLSKAAIDRISRQVTLGLMGQKTPYAVMGEIGRNLKSKSIFKSIAERAEVITRTEAGRALEAAGQARKEQWAKEIPGLKKRWHYGHSPRMPRTGHVAIAGQTRAVDKFFDVAGEKLMYPKDPRGSAKNTIRCGCKSIVWHDDWEKLAA